MTKLTSYFTFVTYYRLNKHPFLFSFSVSEWQLFKDFLFGVANVYYQSNIPSVLIGSRVRLISLFRAADEKPIGEKNQMKIQLAVS